MKQLKQLNEYTKEHKDIINKYNKYLNESNIVKALKCIQKLPEEIIANSEIILPLMPQLLLFNLYDEMYKYINLYKEYNQEDVWYYLFLTEYYLYCNKHYKYYLTSLKFFEFSDKKTMNFLPILKSTATFSAAPDFIEFFNCIFAACDILGEEYKNNINSSQNMITFPEGILWNDDFELKMIKNDESKWDLLIIFDFNIYDLKLLMTFKEFFEFHNKNISPIQLVARNRKLPDYLNSQQGKEFIKNIKFDLIHNKNNSGFNIVAYIANDDFDSFLYAHYLEFYFRLLLPFKQYKVKFENNQSEDLYSINDLFDIIDSEYQFYKWPRKYYYHTKLINRLYETQNTESFITNELNYWKKHQNFDKLGYLHEIGVYFLKVTVKTNDVIHTLANSFTPFCFYNSSSVYIEYIKTDDTEFEFLCMLLDSSSRVLESMYDNLFKSDKNVQEIILDPLQNLTDKKFTLCKRDNETIINNISKYKYEFYINNDLEKIIYAELEKLEKEMEQE